jgi:flagellar biosynthetic protein FlhB
MADEADDAERTEEPTPRRLEDAAKHGDVIKSQEVTTLVVLAAGTLSVALFGPAAATHFVLGLKVFLARPDQIAVDPASIMAVARQIGWTMLVLLGAPLGLLLGAGVAAHVVQARPVFTAEKIKPDLSKLSLTHGFQRLFGIDGWVALLKGTVKMALVAGALWAVLWPDRVEILAILQQSPRDIAGNMMRIALHIALATLSVLTLVAILDYLNQRMQFLKRNRMSRHEIKEEIRQSDGDPLIKAKIRQIRMERSRRRMMARVPQATVVVMNPTHYAVALQYEAGNMTAPVCVAKGVDAVALRIRDKAKEHNVPVVENPPLARALYAAVEIDESIPPEHYKAVAQVIGYVLKLSGRMRPN